MVLPKVWLNLEPHPATFEVLEGKAEIIGPLVRPDPDNPLSEIEEAEGTVVGACPEHVDGLYASILYVLKCLMTPKGSYGLSNVCTVNPSRFRPWWAKAKLER